MTQLYYIIQKNDKIKIYKVTQNVLKFIESSKGKLLSKQGLTKSNIIEIEREINKKILHIYYNFTTKKIIGNVEKIICDNLSCIYCGLFQTKNYIIGENIINLHSLKIFFIDPKSNIPNQKYLKLSNKNGHKWNITKDFIFCINKNKKDVDVYDMECLASRYKLTFPIKIDCVDLYKNYKILGYRFVKNCLIIGYLMDNPKFVEYKFATPIYCAWFSKDPNKIFIVGIDNNLIIFDLLENTKIKCSDVGRINPLIQNHYKNFIVDANKKLYYFDL